MSEQAQAAIEAMYDACKVAIEEGSQFMPARDYFEKLLGDTAHAYEIRGYESLLRERNLYRDALDEIRDLGRFSSNAQEAAASQIAASALNQEPSP